MKVIYFLCVLLCLAGCKDEKYYDSSVAKVDSLYREARLKLNDSTTFINLVKDQVATSNAIGYSKGLAKAYYLNAYFYDINFKFIDAAKNYFKCLNHAKEEGLEKFTYNSHFNLGRINFLSANYNKSRQYYNRALELSLKNNNRTNIADAYEKVGLCYLNESNFTQAKISFNKGVEINKVLDDDGKIAYLYNLLGITYKDTGDIDSAFYYYDKALETAIGATNEENIIATVFDAKGIAFLELADTLKAKQMFFGSISKNSLNNKKLAIIYNNLGEVFQKEDSLEFAIGYFKQAINLSNEHDYDRQLIKAQNHLYKIYQSINDHHNERFYGNILSDVTVPLLNFKENLENLNSQYQLHEIEQDQIEKRLALKIERIYYWLTLTFLALGLTAAGYLLSRYRLKWRKLKDKYNHFVTIYHDFLREYRAAIARQLQLHRELGTLPNTPMKGPWGENLWKNDDDEDDDKDKEE